MFMIKQSTLTKKFALVTTRGLIWVQLFYLELYSVRAQL